LAAAFNKHHNLCRDFENDLERTDGLYQKKRDGDFHPEHFGGYYKLQESTTRGLALMEL
jgi:hypothetical protein